MGRNDATSGAAAEEHWHPARLIPVAGIRGEKEQEKRATSALLAVMGAVPDFGHALLGTLGAPRGRIRGFAEVQLHDIDGNLSTPDGAIVVERGRTRWTCLIEVKTGASELKPDQVDRYIDMARLHCFDCLLTISNEITARPDEPPVAIDRRRTRRVRMFHLSWWRIITEAVLQHRFRGIADPDQAWILGELIAYLDHENSGASGFDDMGDSWVRVRDAARQGTIRAVDKDIRAVAERWEHFIDYLALGLSQDLGRDVTAVLQRGQSPAERVETLASRLVTAGQLAGAVRVPDAVAPIWLTADLRSRQLTTAIALDAPREGRPRARINWILRQLSNAPPQLRVSVAFVNVRETTSLLLSEATEYPQRLLSNSEPRRDPRSFELAVTRPMGVKRGKGQGSFIRESRRQLFDFYGDVVQNIKKWQAKAPKLPDVPDEVPETPQPEPPPFVAADLREVGEASTPTEPSVERDAT